MINDLNCQNNHKKTVFSQPQNFSSCLSNQLKMTQNSQLYQICSQNNSKIYTGIKHRNTPLEERQKYVVNIEDVINEKDKRTTLMIKNIPRDVTQGFLIGIFEGGFKGEFDFFYLPIDFVKKENAGYAFINFKNTKSIINFLIEYDGKPWPFLKSKKCFISYARIQGFKAIVHHFSTSNINNIKDDSVKPYINYE